MEEETEMEVEESRSENSIKRFGLKNCIQTNFGDDYVFQIVPKEDWSLMGVSLSTNAVKLYSPVTGQYFGECTGHSATINQISFLGPSTPHVLHSCSSDGTISAWDTRSFQQVSSLSAGSQEIFSFSFGGADDNLLAAGCGSQILFWDWRNKKQVACLEESHDDDVTQVHFVPDHQNKFVSASEDGLICTYHTGGNINDDDHLESCQEESVACQVEHLSIVGLCGRYSVLVAYLPRSARFDLLLPFSMCPAKSTSRSNCFSVINVGTSIGKVGFFGETYQKLWCLTHIETLSIWDWKEGQNEANFENARSLASDSWALDQVDYFVDCHYTGEGESLWVIGGTGAGTMGYFPVNHKGAATIGSPEAVLGGGHTAVVRSVLPMSSMQGRPAQIQGIFGWTGGEDGRLCCWLSDESSETNRSWISSAMVMKSSKTRNKSRHHPY
ncbi:hypothetical protein JRO89_XS01G0371900 [Xanthoceras sorbifolium]|uniref:WD repeat-containing protein 89 homolog n=1 Tax=Xanthoceras sorbifolium TaxID=99658 RepID=A0ABQ8IPM8_9ROSI|nr:hypothetical protein JRO89_XS01G0371900 [Xanthoceras sorbifolium]